MDLKWNKNCNTNELTDSTGRFVIKRGKGRFYLLVDGKRNSSGNLKKMQEKALAILQEDVYSIKCSICEEKVVFNPGEELNPNHLLPRGWMSFLKRKSSGKLEQVVYCSTCCDGNKTVVKRKRTIYEIYCNEGKHLKAREDGEQNKITIPFRMEVKSYR